MREEFISKNFRPATLLIIKRANEIIGEYDAQGLRLTLRQLYYQFVTRNWLPNLEKSYKNLGSAISDGRLAGLIDWDSIEDRVRVPLVPGEFKNLQELVDVALRSYRLPRWASQPNYVELWVEKDALAGVLAPIADDFHITLMVNRGYSSQSAMYESAQRFLRQNSYKENYLLYLGDHDPSGEDMVRDIRERLHLFGASLTVEKLALTMEQVRHYNPPPNPAKMSDSRAEKYVNEHGYSSWEVDALPPNVLNKLIVKRLSALVDAGMMEKVKQQEEKDKKRLYQVVRKTK